MNGTFILLIIAGYFLVLMIVSWLTGRNGDNKTFFLGNKQMPWMLVAFGMIGTSISGVTFVSVPGMPLSIDMTYMQTVLGFSLGYFVVAHLFLPLYYKLNLTSIYTYLGQRFGDRAYRTGASFFLLSKIIGAAARLYIVALILQAYVFETWHVPFPITVCGTVLLIWLYSHRSGVKTIVWTDALQTFCLLGALILIICKTMQLMQLDLAGVAQTLSASEHFRIFEFDDWISKQNFFKQFISGIFITIVMTGLDQDMMQKNLSCKSLKDAQKNMYVYGIAFIPVNFLFLCLGVLLITYAGQAGIAIPEVSDEMLPLFATQYLGPTVLIFFCIGIIAAAFSSADSALTALTTSFCIDILRVDRMKEEKAIRIRKRAHIVMSAIFILIILIIKELNNKSIIDAIYTIASYTYGPLLGLFMFGLFTERKSDDRRIPYIAVASPIICFVMDYLSSTFLHYKFGYEMLMINGLLTALGLYIVSTGSPSPKIKNNPSIPSK